MIPITERVTVQIDTKLRNAIYEEGVHDLELRYRFPNQMGAPGGEKCACCLSICFLATKDNTFKQQEASKSRRRELVLQVQHYNVESKSSKIVRNHG